MRSYLTLLQDILDNGNKRPDRTGVGTIGVFGRQIRLPLSEGFPLLTTKKMFIKGIIHELLWFLKGETNIKYLVDNGISLWTDWPLKAYNEDLTIGKKLTKQEFEEAIRHEPGFAEEWGDLGPLYGKSWRKWKGPLKNHWDISSNDDRDSYKYICSYGEHSFDFYQKQFDQISELITNLRKDPFSRRHVVSAWNVGDIPEMALAPCHCLFQTFVRERDGGRFLDCQLYQRSGDIFLGIPCNIASYAFLTHMVAQQINAIPGDFIHTFGDLHIYQTHLEQVKEQLTRQPKPLPKLELRKAPDIFSYQREDFRIIGYDPEPAIPAPVAV